MSANQIRLLPKPLTSDAFDPFGDVIEIAGKSPIMINDGNTERYDSLARIATLGNESYGVINVFRVQPRQLPMSIHMLERHPFGSQAFYPLSGEDYLVLVADAVIDIRPDNLHLFLAKKDQGVNYRANTWHHPILALNKECDFLVIDRKGKEHNCEEFHFAEDVHIEINLLK